MALPANITRGAHVRALLVVFSLFCSLSAHAAPRTAEQEAVATLFRIGLGMDADAERLLGKAGIACMADEMAGRFSAQQLAALGSDTMAAGEKEQVMGAIVDVMFDCHMIGRFMSIGVAKESGKALSSKTVRCIDDGLEAQRGVLRPALVQVVNGQEPTEDVTMKFGLLMMSCMSKKEMQAIAGE